MVGALQVLIVLSKNPGIMLTELLQKVDASSKTVMRAVNHLLKIGLIKEVREEEFPRRRRLYPTEKGRRIGELLEKIEEVLREG